MKTKSVNWRATNPSRWFSVPSPSSCCPLPSVELLQQLGAVPVTGGRSVTESKLHIFFSCKIERSGGWIHCFQCFMSLFYFINRYQSIKGHGPTRFSEISLPVIYTFQWKNHQRDERGRVVSFFYFYFPFEASDEYGKKILPVAERKREGQKNRKKGKKELYIFAGGGKLETGEETGCGNQLVIAMETQRVMSPSTQQT